jgi:hypothetical protein
LAVVRLCIEAHLTIVFAALAVSRFVEDRTGWSIRTSARTARRHRIVQIRAGAQLLTAEDPLSEDLRTALARISGPEGAHRIEPSRDAAHIVPARSCRSPAPSDRAGGPGPPGLASNCELGSSRRPPKAISSSTPNRIPMTWGLAGWTDTPAVGRLPQLMQQTPA